MEEEVAGCLLSIPMPFTVKPNGPIEMNLTPSVLANVYTILSYR